MELSSPNGLQLFDIGNAGDGSDIRVFFSADHTAEEVEEYRVLLVAAGEGLTVEEAVQVPANQYLAVPKVNRSYKANLSAGQLAVGGAAIQVEGAYQVYVLAVASLEQSISALSAPSPTVTLESTPLYDVYTSSSDSHSVEIHDGVTGEHLGSLVAPASGGLQEPQEVIFLQNGTVLVTGFRNAAIKQYDATTGAYLGDFTHGYTLDMLTKTSIGPDGHLWVSQWGETQSAIVRFDTSTGNFIDEVIPSFYQGMGHTWDAEGNLYVVSWGLAQLRKYDASFALVAQTQNALSGPVNIWYREADDLLYVVDWATGQVKRYTTDLEYQDTYMTGMVRTEGYLVDNETLLLGDWEGDVVERYSLETGAFLGTFIRSGIDKPNGLAFGPDRRPE